MNDHFLRSLDDVREEQEALLERDLDPDMALVSDYLSGELTEEQNAMVREKLVKDPAFRDLAEPLMLAYEHAPRRAPLPREELERRWLELRRRIGLPDIPGHERKPDAEMTRFRSEVEHTKRSSRKRMIFAFAAVMVLTLVPPGLMLVNKIRSSQVERTAWGSTEIMSLRDGSRATLQSGTRLVQIGEASVGREYVLTGEAAFEVTPGTTPFVVWTGSASITVTGTKFTVHAYSYEPTQLSVSEGSVVVQPRNEDGDPFGLQVKVTAGQRARIIRGFPVELLK